MRETRITFGEHALTRPIGVTDENLGRRCPECVRSLQMSSSVAVCPRRVTDVTDFAGIMRTWREKNKLSADKAAKAVGCTTPAWVDWEKGQPVSDPWRGRIAQVMAEMARKGDLTNGTLA